MKDDWLNKNLEEKLDGYDSPMDLENAWESLQTKRQEPKKKNRIFFFWMILGFASIGFGGSYFLSNNSTLTENSNEENNQVHVLEKTKIVPPTLSQFEKTNSNNATDKTFTSIENQNNTSENINYENQNVSDQEIIKSTLDSKTSFSKTGNNNLNPPNTNFDLPENSKTDLIFLNQNEVKNDREKDSTNPENENQQIAISFLPGLEMSLLELLEVKPKSFSNLLFSKNDKLDTSTFLVGCIPSRSYLNISAGYGIRSKGKVLDDENLLDVISLNALYEKRIMNRKTYFKTGISFDQFVNSIQKTIEQSWSCLLYTSPSPRDRG